VPELEFVLPGDPETRTGGYEYDRRIVAGLRALGWTVRVHALPGDWPSPSATDRAEAARRFAALPDGARVVVDGLAFGTLPEVAAAQAARLRLVALVHHPLAEETGIAAATAERLAASERAALSAARRVVVTSAPTAVTLTDYGVEPSRCVVIEPGTDAAPTARGTGSAGPPLLLVVATLTPRKGHALLFEALAGLTDRAWRLECVGSDQRDPATAAALRAQVATSGLADRIALRGEAGPEGIAAAYDGADLFVWPSLYEGYGMALAEALAHGLPVVATRVGAAAALVGDDAGLLVPPGDVAALHAALARWLDEPSLREQCAAGAARARARLPRWDQACAGFAQVLEALA
jgi:glycosyltransferase involved in cell wall biosynthesis